MGTYDLHLFRERLVFTPASREEKNYAVAGAAFGLTGALAAQAAARQAMKKAIGDQPPPSGTFEELAALPGAQRRVGPDGGTALPLGVIAQVVSAKRGGEHCFP